MKVYARDVIAVVVLILLFHTKIRGYNGTVDAMIALVIGYYFSKRVYEEKNGGKK
jgi:hypothetical protein